MKKLLLFIFAFFPLIASSYISDGLFNGFWYKDLQYADIGDGTCFVGFHGAMSETEWEKYSGDVVIPEYADGKRVIAIGVFAFLDCTEMTSITIPETIIEIGPSSFLDCRGLTSINIPGSVKTIGKWAFEGCSGLASIELQEGLTTIEKAAFKNCSSLTSVTIPGSVTSIGENVFAGCNNLKTINIIISDLSALANRKIESAFDSSIEMHYIYKGEEITDLVIPEGVTSIGDYVFAGCSSMTSITIPSSVTSIGKDVFDGCTNLKSVYISDLSAWCSINIHFLSAPFRRAQHLYLNGDEIKNLVVPDGVTSIGNNAFAHYKGLTSVTIPSSVTSIGEDAFAFCDNLSSVSIPQNVTTISDGAFAGCNLETLTIPSSVTSIGKDAFSLYEASSIIVESDNPNYDSRNNCNALIETKANKLILGCKNTVIPDGVTSIGPSALSGCCFTSVTIPQSVTNIGEMALGCCPKLASITVENGNPNYDSRDNCNAVIESKSNKLIVGCKNTIIPNSVTSIGQYAFWALPELKSIVIPQSVETIDDYAFISSTSLTTIYSFRKEPPTCYGNSTFSRVGNGKCTVWVPKGCVEAYKEADGWKDFQDIREMIDNDVNLDGKVDYEDVSALATNISNASADINISDINGDNEVNVADVVALINKMNGQALLGETAFYLIGDHNGWNTTDKTYAFTRLADGKTWEITIPSEGAGCFKVAPGSAYNHQDVSFWSYLLCAEYDQYTGLHGIMQQGDIMAAWLLNTEGATSYTIRIVPSEMTYKIIPN